MKIIEWKDFINNELSHGKIAMTVGVFDGVHKGHKALMQRITAQSGLIPVVLTFREPIHKSERAGFTVQSFEEKADALASLGIKALIVVDFTEDFGRMTGIEFLETLLDHADIGFFAAGANFRCGNGLDTDAKAVKSFFTGKGIPAEIAPEVLHDGLPISSSRIRDALAEGDLELVEELIG